MKNSLDLLKIVNKRYKASNSKALRTQLSHTFEVLKTDHSLKVFSLTLLFPSDSLESSWSLGSQRLEELLTLIKEYPFLGFILSSVEVHRSSRSVNLLKLTSSKKQLVGNCHFHLCIGMYNDFLCPDTSHLFLDLRSKLSNEVDLHIEELSTVFNISNWFLYCLKESRDNTYQSWLKSYFPSEKTSSTLYNFLPELDNYFVNLVSFSTKTGHNLTYFNNKRRTKLPSVPYSPDEKVRMTLFMRAFMEEHKYGLLATTQELYELSPNSLYTYTPSKQTLSSLYGSLWESFPIKARSMLNKSTYWVLKTTKDLGHLPTIALDTQLIEVIDGLYSFALGKFYMFNDPKCQLLLSGSNKIKAYSSRLTFNPTVTKVLSASSSYWPLESFNNLTFPINLLSLLTCNCERPAVDFLLRVGSLFHKRDASSLVMYVYGKSGSDKSLLLYNILTKVFSEGNIGRIDSTLKPFAYSDLVLKWLCFLNDLNENNLNETFMLNLLKGNKVPVNRKYKNAVKIEPNHTVITSNYLVPKALEHRLDCFYFEQLDENLTRESREKMSDLACKEALGFTILSNLVYLNKLKATKKPDLILDIPLNWILEHSLELNSLGLKDN